MSDKDELAFLPSVLPLEGCAPPNLFDGDDDIMTFVEKRGDDRRRYVIVTATRKRRHSRLIACQPDSCD